MSLPLMQITVRLHLFIFIACA